MSRFDRWAGGLVMVAGLLAAGAVVTVAATAPASCVPARAVDYRGDLGAWLDGAGRVVLLAPEEDTYPWCG